jgi:hypothetical protein
MKLDDIAWWSDGTWCFGSELEEYLSFMSDDYETIRYGTVRWHAINN